MCAEWVLSIQEKDNLYLYVFIHPLQVWYDFDNVLKIVSNEEEVVICCNEKGSIFVKVLEYLVMI